MMKLLRPILTLIAWVSCLSAYSQQTGVIIRTATSTAGSNVLDPVLKGYTSATSAGFLGDDVANSEIPYKPIPAFSMEPFGDLRRGPNHLYSDFVPDQNGRGVYCYYDNTNLLFRFRLGSVMPGSKGYSILLDTDERFGATGPAADPNYQPATTGVNGNPGYEIEIVLETNFRIAIYNVDGSSTPTLVTQYTNWQDMSQVSIAGTNDNGDPDFYMDFYIPFSALQASPFNLTASTKVRMSATTVMAPKAAIGGPKSDIYGVNSSGDEEEYIRSQCSFSIAEMQTPTVCPMCTAPPVLSGPFAGGTINITGTWTRSSLPGSYGRALIRIYRNGNLIATDDDSTNSGASWSISGVTVSGGDVITARAHGANESMCLSSNAVTVQSCNAANVPSNTGLAITCHTGRGIEGTFPAGHQVRLYFIDPATGSASLVAGPTPNGAAFNYSGSNWYYNGTSFNGQNEANACSGGSPDLANGTYFVTTAPVGGTCESSPVFSCFGLGSTTAVPTITQTALYNSSRTISGNATTGTTVRLRINGVLVANTTAAAGAYSFNNLTLMEGDRVEVRAIVNGSCMSPAASMTVSCFTKPPLINADENGIITAGQPITGTSPDAIGTTVRVYVSTNTTTPVATANVVAGGLWSTSFNAAAGAQYYAVAERNGCSLSAASSNATAQTKTAASKCGAITVPSPVTATATDISGTLNGNSSNTTVSLYLDGVKIGTATTNNNTWGPIAVNTSDINTRLYANGILTIGIQDAGTQEVACPASAVAIQCTPAPVTPNISSSTNTTVGPNQSVSYTISNAQSGYFYALALAGTGESMGEGRWATSNGSLTLTTKNLAQSGTYNIVVKGTAINGLNVCAAVPAAASVTVTAPLPVQLLAFRANRSGAAVQLDWSVAAEENMDRYEVERSSNGRNFQVIASKNAQNTLGRISYNTLDAQPLNGISYYRLKMIEQNGQSSYSRVVVLNSNGTSITLQSVLPNPFRHELNIAVQTGTRGFALAELVDVNGRILHSRQFALASGQNIVKWNGLESLSHGVYLLRISIGEVVLQEKLVH